MSKAELDHACNLVCGVLPPHGQSPSRSPNSILSHPGYFPISLVKTQDLPADRKYVFGYHPHGIIGMGAISNFATEGELGGMRGISSFCRMCDVCF